MQLIQAFDANMFDPTQGVGSLPIGRHPVIIESSEVKANKANDGGYLQLNLRIIDGPQAGTVGAYRLNLYHSNQQTVEIANRQLSAVCHVTGVFKVTDSSQLHNLPFVIEVGPQKNDAQYTEVKKVFDMNGNEPGKAGAGQAQQTPQGFGQGQQQPQQQQPQQQGAAWGGQPANGGQQQAAPQQGAAWGGQGAQGQQAPQQQGGAAWGGQQGQAAPAQQGNPAQGGAAWGGGQQQAAPQQNAAPQGGGWNQGGQAAPAQGGAAPWGQR